ncbi:hypothetical protein AB0K51_09495 [Kitasatospora sp. NPDC049285]|uniref:hypothetical protein n=1 Tax=Kitasatospora sp. NPDC049285 TaxID=3157096 RepID=UPI00342ADC1C
MNLAPIPAGRDADPTWLLVHQHYVRLITPLRARGYVVDIKNAAKAAARTITAALPDGTRLTITTGNGLPLHPGRVRCWVVEHKPKSEDATVLVYDSTPSGLDRSANAILSPLLVALDKHIAAWGLGELPPGGHPVAIHYSHATDARFGPVEHAGEYADLATALVAYQGHEESLTREGWRRLWTHPCSDWPRTMWGREGTVMHVWTDLAELCPLSLAAPGETP